MIQIENNAELPSCAPTLESHRWKVIDDVLVSFTIPGPIHDHCWDRFLADIDGKRPRYCLTLCIGAVQVAAAQRLRSTRVLLRAKSRVAVVTNNRMTRGLAMGVAWFGAPLDGYSWPELEQALATFDVGPATRVRLRDEAMAFRRKYPALD